MKNKSIKISYLFYDIVKVAAGIPGLIWHRPKIYYENSAAKKRIKNGAIVISNHLGFFDPIYLQYAIWYRRHHFICLQKFIDGKLGWLFKGFLCIPIDKENFSINSFHTIIDHLKNDEMVSMFPEGKVNDGSGQMAQFKSGVVLMAMQSAKPIVPVYILQKKKWFERIRIIIGEPVAASSGNFKAVSETTRLLENKILNLREMLEDKYANKK